MPEDKQRAQIGAYLSRLDRLIARGGEVRELIIRNSADAATVSANRTWQQECGITIHELSGGSKAHWLSRAFSEALLMRSADGQAVEGAKPEQLVQRLMGVLERAKSSLSQMGEQAAPSMGSESAPHRFDFVQNANVRPILEQAYSDSRSALEAGDYELAMCTSCSILEAIVTDALKRKSRDELSASGAPEENVMDWAFEARLAIAEKTGLIRGGWARLPEAARRYRENDQHGGITERDARTAGQVLNVVMRDLNPGR